MKRVRVFVSGRVQGVFFRHSTVELARSLGVSGWARNLADGRVEAVFQGSEKSVDAMIAWCHQGPPAARVESVESFEELPDSETTRFHARD